MEVSALKTLALNSVHDAASCTFLTIIYCQQQLLPCPPTLNLNFKDYEHMTNGLKAEF